MLVLTLKLGADNEGSVPLGIYSQTTRRVELIRKKEFATTVFNPEYKVFVVHIMTLSVNSGHEIYPSQKT